jgi:predicted nucleotidyltransferase
MKIELLIMVVGRPAILGEIIDRLPIAYDPLKVVLYGSYARNEATEDIDIDLLIVTNTSSERPVDRFVEMKRRLREGTGDLLGTNKRHDTVDEE